jgi:hypothetical protein
MTYIPVKEYKRQEGWRIQRDTPGYGPRHNADELRRDLMVAMRYNDPLR